MLDASKKIESSSGHTMSPRCRPCHGIVRLGHHAGQLGHASGLRLCRARSETRREEEAGAREISRILFRLVRQNYRRRRHKFKHGQTLPHRITRHLSRPASLLEPMSRQQKQEGRRVFRPDDYDFFTFWGSLLNHGKANAHHPEGRLHSQLRRGGSKPCGRRHKRARTSQPDRREPYRSPRNPFKTFLFRHPVGNAANQWPRRYGSLLSVVFCLKA